MGVLAPACALAGSARPRPALFRASALSITPPSGATRAGHLGERRALVAEDPRVAVLVGADRSRIPRSASTRAQTSIGCSAPGYSGYDSIRSKVVSARVRATSNSGHEDRHLAGRVLREGHRPLVRQEAEAGRVLDVGLVEEDDPVRPCARACSSRRSRRSASSAPGCPSLARLRRYRPLGLRPPLNSRAVRASIVSDVTDRGVGHVGGRSARARLRAGGAGRLPGGSRECEPRSRRPARRRGRRRQDGPHPLLLRRAGGPGGHSARPATRCSRPGLSARWWKSRRRSEASSLRSSSAAQCRTRLPARSCRS